MSCDDDDEGDIFGLYDASNFCDYLVACPFSEDGRNTYVIRIDNHPTSSDVIIIQNLMNLATTLDPIEANISGNSFVFNHESTSSSLYARGAGRISGRTIEITFITGGFIGCLPDGSSGTIDDTSCVMTATKQ